MSHRMARLTILGPYLLMALVVGTTLLGEVPLGRQPEAGGCIGISQAVGGISVDAAGVLKNAGADVRNELREVRNAALQEIAGDLRVPHELRKISLRRLEAAIAQQQATGKPIPDEIRYLAGLQRIRYMLVDADKHDIVLAGFGEGWEVDAYGNLIGLTSGRPVMQLDDLLVALRTFSVQGRGMTCSIDPTPEGMKQLREYVSKLTTIGEPERTRDTIEQLLGPQTITITGVDPTSHFARVMVAADYRMKRLGMNFDPSPVPGMPSYVQLTKAGGRGMQNLTPRWWLVPQYERVLTDGEGLAWELRGGSVKCLTEDSYFDQDGSRAQAGRSSPAAQRWADTMTAKYDELSLKDPIFGELRNCMELAIAAALIVREDLTGRADCPLPLLLDQHRLATEQYAAPRHTDTKANFVKKSSNWVITASGGVQIGPGTVLSKAQTSEELKAYRRANTAGGKSWWWN
jgi:hypothetical protein